MVAFLLAVYFIICVLLIVAILIQSNKGTSIAGVFGGGSDTFLGASSAVTWLNKATTWLAIAFLVASFLLMMVPLVKGPSRIPLDIPTGSEQSGAMPAAPIQGEGAASIPSDDMP